eukprot:jgi/Mesen1/1572/ME000134S00692
MHSHAQPQGNNHGHQHGGRGRANSPLRGGPGAGVGNQGPSTSQQQQQHQGEGAASEKETFRWARCKLLTLSEMRRKGVPLPSDCTQVLQAGLSWEEIQWAPAGVIVRGVSYPLTRAHFMPKRQILE